MKILIVGSGKGSWSIRGQQLGASLGARVTSAPTAKDVAWADLVVLVKRAILHRAAAACGKPLVWDALDFWTQPGQNGLCELDAVALARQHLDAVGPVLTIGATEAMAQAIGGVYLPHHAWFGLSPTPARAHIQTVAYQGGEMYLGRWRQVLMDACRARGWTFVVNPPDLSQADLIVGFRDGIWDGWICRQWKSGVKAVNAIAAGRPFISQASAAVSELQPDGSVVETEAQLQHAFDFWTPVETRAAVVDRSRSLAPTFTVDAIAARYRALLQEQVMRCAA